MDTLDLLDQQEAKDIELAREHFRAAIRNGKRNEIPPEEFQKWLTILGISRDTVREMEAARKQVENLQKDDPTDEKIAAANDAFVVANQAFLDLPFRQDVERRIVAGTLNREKSAKWLLEHKRETVRRQIAQLKRKYPDAFP